MTKRPADSLGDELFAADSVPQLLESLSKRGVRGTAERVESSAQLGLLGLLLPHLEAGPAVLEARRRVGAQVGRGRAAGLPFKVRIG